MIEIITNNVPRDTIGWFDLSRKEREQMGFADRSDPFIRYRGYIYCIGSFERTNVPGWDGQYCESVSTGVLCRALPDGRVVVASYRCCSDRCD